MGNRHLTLRLGLLTGLTGSMAWLFLAPHPLPFGISIQREMGFVGHAGVFAMVTLACVAAFPHAHWRIATALLVTAFCLEATQIFIPTRSADFTDFAMNCVGIQLGLVAFRISAVLLASTHWKRTSQTKK